MENPKGLLQELEARAAPRVVGSSRRGAGREPALRTRVQREAPAERRARSAGLRVQGAGCGSGFSSRAEEPGFPGAGWLVHCSHLRGARESACQREFISGKRETRCEAGVGGLQASTREGKGGNEQNYFALFPKPHKTAPDVVDDLLNPRRI